MLKENHRIKEPDASFPPGSAIKLSNKRKAFLPGFLTFIILSSLIGILAYQRLLLNKERIQKETLDFLFASKENLQETLLEGITATKTLSFFIQNDGSVKDFDSLASQILVNTDIDILQ